MTYTYPTLYAKSKHGKIKVWSIDVCETDGTVSISTQHGFLDGAIQIDTKNIVAGKNIGKANETTVWDQAISEAQSTYNKQIDKRYRPSIEEIPEGTDDYFLPMLAQKYSQHSAKITFPAYGQPKLDGIRAISDGEELWSRAGKPLTVPTHIIEQLPDFISNYSDGELYVHGWTFQRVTAAVKKMREDTLLLQYHVYDRPDPELSFEERFVNWTPVNTENIIKVETVLLNNETELEVYEADCVARGYEGAIVRNAAGLYEYGHRSYDLQKIKRFQDAEFKIIDTTDGVGRDKNAIIFRCETEKGLVFDVRPAVSYELRYKMWEKRDQYIGKLLTVKFFEYTEDGIPRFPVGLHLREEWDL